MRSNANEQTVFITGMDDVDEDTLLYADLNNQNVKKLEISTGQTTVIFIENENDWRVVNAKKFNDKLGESLFVMENNNNNKTRVCIGKWNDVIYKTDQQILFDETSSWVCENVECF